MKCIAAIALLFVASLANAGSFVYEAAFNQHGFATMQTATMTAGDAAVVWFITPVDGPEYLIQIRSADGSDNVEHLVTVVEAESGMTVMTQVGYYPSFYVTIGANIKGATPYIMYINNADASHNQTCQKGAACDLSVLIQPAQ